MSMDMLIERIREKSNPTIAGLDPKVEFIPDFIKNVSYEKYGKTLKGAANAVWEFNKVLIDNLHDIVPAVKPQAAYYEMYGVEGEIVMHKTMEYAKQKGMFVLLDVKRNDIGPTAEAYARAYLSVADVDGEKIPVSAADCITINPYLGTDGIKPFIDAAKEYDKSMFVLVKTSNPSSGELQDLILDGRAVYEKVASLVSNWGMDTIGKYGYSKVGAVVGATYPKQAEVLREKMKHTFFLVPGYGAQGAGASDVAKSFDKNGEGAIVNSSRGIMCAYKKGDYKPEQFGIAARDEAIRMKNELNSVL